MSHGTKSPSVENKLETLGLFSFDSSVSVGTKYGSHPDPDRLIISLFNRTLFIHCIMNSRTKGKQFGVNFPKEGNLNDSTFNAFTSLKVGDKYITPEDMRR